MGFLSRALLCGSLLFLGGGTLFAEVMLKTSGDVHFNLGMKLLKWKVSSFESDGGYLKFGLPRAMLRFQGIKGPYSYSFRMKFSKANLSFNHVRLGYKVNDMLKLTFGQLEAAWGGYFDYYEFKRLFHDIRSDYSEQRGLGTSIGLKMGKQKLTVTVLNTEVNHLNIETKTGNKVPSPRNPSDEDKDIDEVKDTKVESGHSPATLNYAVQYLGHFMNGMLSPALSFKLRNGSIHRNEATKDLDESRKQMEWSAGLRISAFNAEIEGDVVSHSQAKYKEFTDHFALQEIPPNATMSYVFLVRYKLPQPKIHPFFRFSMGTKSVDGKDVEKRTGWSGGLEFYPDMETNYSFNVFAHGENREWVADDSTSGRKKDDYDKDMFFGAGVIARM